MRTGTSVKRTALSRAVTRDKASRVSRREWIYGYLFIAPMFLGFLLFVLGPMIIAFIMGFTDWKLVGDINFVGLDNYTHAFTDDPVFWQSFWNTLYFTAGLVPLNMLLSLGLALLLKEKFFGIGVFRTIIFTPVVTPIVVWAILWKFIFQTDNGLVNMVLKFFHVEGPAWLYNIGLVMPVVIIVSVLKGLGYNMVIFLAALNEVPALYYEAARIDGANKWQMFRNVTLPMITPSIFLVSTLIMISSLKAFGQIFVLTGGGPGTHTYVMVYYIYEQAFKVFHMGYASAIAFILFTMILVITLIQWAVRKRWVHYED